MVLSKNWYSKLLNRYSCKISCVVFVFASNVAALQHQSIKKMLWLLPITSTYFGTGFLKKSTVPHLPPHWPMICYCWSKKKPTSWPTFPLDSSFFHLIRLLQQLFVRTFEHEPLAKNGWKKSPTVVLSSIVPLSKNLTPVQFFFKITT